MMKLAAVVLLCLAMGAHGRVKTKKEKVEAVEKAYAAYKKALEDLGGGLHQLMLPEYTNVQTMEMVNTLRSRYAKVNHIPRESRRRVSSRLVAADSVAVLVGDNLETRTGSDTEVLFRQESNFIYATGFDHPGAKVMIGLDPNSNTIKPGEAWLFVPRGDPVWVGRTETLEDYAEKYDVDKVFWIEDYDKQMGILCPRTVFTFSGVSPWGPHPPPCRDNMAHDTGSLLNAFNEARDVKTPDEVAMIRAASVIGCEEHQAIMTHIRCGMYESDAESLFRYVGHNYGSRFQSYIPIVGSGPNSAALHYNDNDMVIPEGSVVLVDAAAELGATRNGGGYASDITRTWPCNGRFTGPQKQIYDVVFAAQNACIRNAVVGGSMSKAIKESEEAMVKGLLDVGILVGGTVDDMLKEGMNRIFMPHGLGHGVGLDVHDISTVMRVPFVVGHVFTCEPGIYFYPSLLNEAYNNPNKARYLNKALIDEQFINMGGIRIEDLIHVSENGPDNLSANLPRSSSEIEAFMARTRAAHAPQNTTRTPYNTTRY